MIAPINVWLVLLLLHTSRLSGKYTMVSACNCICLNSLSNLCMCVCVCVCVCVHVYVCTRVHVYVCAYAYIEQDLNLYVSQVLFFNLGSENITCYTTRHGEQSTCEIDLNDPLLHCHLYCELKADNILGCVQDCEEIPLLCNAINTRAIKNFCCRESLCNEYNSSLLSTPTVTPTGKPPFS